MIVLDTHAWIWWVSRPGKLSPQARASIDHEEVVGLCPVSCWEIATKVVQGRIALDRDLRIWMKQALAVPRLDLLKLDPEISIRAAELGSEGFHGDPADRMIMATALFHRAGLVTKDRRIRSFPHISSIW